MNEFKLELKAKHFENDPLGYLVVEAQVDDKPIVNFDEFAIDLRQFQRSAEDSGQFFIITCWCGDPSCAGIEHGIEVHHTDTMVIWDTTIEGNTQHFEFNKEAYLSAHYALQEQAQELLTYLDMANDGELTIVPIRNRPFFRLNAN